MRIIERAEGRYEVQDVVFGRVYRWCPERVVVECGCGEEPILTASVLTCNGCGADHAAVFEEEERAAGGRTGDETLHPWRYDRDREGAGLPC
jgi:hypothetical protein